MALKTQLTDRRYRPVTYRSKRSEAPRRGAAVALLFACDAPLAAAEFRVIRIQRTRRRIAFLCPWSGSLGAQLMFRYD